MPSTGLPHGPFALTRANVAAIARRLPGAYALSRDGVTTSFVVNYVGRSDTDLLARLLCHADDGIYSHFKCVHTSSDTEAFEWESRMFHDFGEETSLDNKMHPDRPNGLAALLYSKCPGCKKFG